MTPQNSSVDGYYTIVVRPGLEHFLTTELEAALEGWRKLNIPDRDSLALDVGQTNVRLSCRHVIEPQEIEAFAAFGVAAVIALANRASWDMLQSKKLIQLLEVPLAASSASRAAA